MEEVWLFELVRYIHKIESSRLRRVLVKGLVYPWIWSSVNRDMLGEELLLSFLLFFWSLVKVFFCNIVLFFHSFHATDLVFHSSSNILWCRSKRNLSNKDLMRFLLILAFLKGSTMDEGTRLSNKQNKQCKSGVSCKIVGDCWSK